MTDDLISRDKEGGTMMKIIIDIPKKVYDQICDQNLDGIMATAIRCGKPLLKDTLPSAQPEQRWIPVSERLPIPNSVDEDVFVYYLVQNEYGDMMVATFVQFPGGARVWQQMYQYGAIMEDIVAWMPLPECYKGES